MPASDCTNPQQVYQFVIHPCVFWQAGDIEAEEQKNFPKWKAESAAQRNELVVSPGFSPWTNRPEFQAKGLKVTPRVKDIMNILVAKVMKSNDMCCRDAKKVVDDVILDVSQSHTRSASTYRGLHKCICTSTVMYTFRHDRAIHPLETLFAHGYPRTLRTTGLSTSAMKEFSGEAMNLPCLATCLWALVSHVNFAKPATTA